MNLYNKFIKKIKHIYQISISFSDKKFNVIDIFSFHIYEMFQINLFYNVKIYDNSDQISLFVIEFI